MPPGFELRENWPQTTRGRVDGSARDDDIDYAILGLHLLERHGAGAPARPRRRRLAHLLPYLQVYTAERAVYRNLRPGASRPATAATVPQPVPRVDRRAHPGRRLRLGAARATACGGRCWRTRTRALSHIANGIYGEMWAAALVACAFTASDARSAIEASLAHVPPRSRLAEALRDVLDIDARGADLGRRRSSAIQRRLRPLQLGPHHQQRSAHRRRPAVGSRATTRRPSA